jgi:hypothetical protein
VNFTALTAGDYTLLIHVLLVMITSLQGPHQPSGKDFLAVAPLLLRAAIAGTEPAAAIARREEQLSVYLPSFVVGGSTLSWSSLDSSTVAAALRLPFLRAAPDSFKGALYVELNCILWAPPDSITAVLTSKYLLHNPTGHTKGGARVIRVTLVKSDGNWVVSRIDVVSIT